MLRAMRYVHSLPGPGLGCIRAPKWACRKELAVSFHQPPVAQRWPQIQCRAESSTSNVVGQLGGRDIVAAGTIDEKEFWVKRITKDDFVATFSRSQGAGGQNVNKVSTKADLRFDLKNCEWASARLKAAVMQREATRMNKQGELLVSNQESRSQLTNLNNATARLQEILDDASDSIKPIESDPTKVKKIQKREKAAARKRLDDKKKHSDKKKSRSNKNFD